MTKLDLASVYFILKVTKMCSLDPPFAHQLAETYEGLNGKATAEVPKMSEKRCLIVS